MATIYGDGHPQWEDIVTHTSADLTESEVEMRTKAKLTNIISGAYRSQGEFPLEEYYYDIGDTNLDIYDRNTVYLISVGKGSFEDDEIEWIKENLPIFDNGEEYQDMSLIKLEFKKWKNNWWNVFRINGTNIQLIGYVRPLMDHLINTIDIDSDGPTPKHYFDDRDDTTIVSEYEKKIIDEFILRQIGNVSVSDINVTPSEVELYVEESVFLNVHVKPTWATNTKYHIASEDTNIVELSNNDLTVTGIGEGNCNLIVTSDEVDKDGEPLVTKLVPVRIKQLYELVNNAYEIKTDPATGNKYITGMEEGMKVRSFATSFFNQEVYVHVYNAYGNDITYDPVEVVQTGSYVQLEIDGTVWDRVDVILLGDLNGDGLINTTDLIMQRKHVFDIEHISYPALVAADVNQDGVVDETDVSMLTHYINTGRWD